MDHVRIAAPHAFRRFALQIALGLALVYRVTGVINLSQGAFCIVGAFTMYTLEQTLSWPAPLAASGAVLATAVFGTALGAATFVPSR